jgi:hypothetical protein
VEDAGTDDVQMVDPEWSTFFWFGVPLALPPSSPWPERILTLSNQNSFTIRAVNFGFPAELPGL